MAEVNVWVYSLISVIVVSLVSLVGLAFLSIKTKNFKKYLIYLVSLAAGALFGGAFLHLLPEVIEEKGFGLMISFFILVGIVLFFVLEKIISWHHCHVHGKHVHTFSVMVLIGDGFHNFIDGLIIGASYLASVPLGLITTFAVILHEIPQEIGDFGVLIQGGYSRSKALMWNFVSALTAILGVIVALILSSYVEGIHFVLVSLAIGGFIYIAGSDLIPELNQHFSIRNSFIQLISFILGILIMALLLFLK